MKTEDRIETSKAESLFLEKKHLEMIHIFNHFPPDKTADSMKFQSNSSGFFIQES